MNLQCTILHVEDNDDDSFLFQRVLSKLHFAGVYQRVGTVEMAFNYLRGVGEYQDRHRFPEPDLIVMDHCLPGRSNTHDLASWLNEQGPACRIPLVMLTGAISLAEQQKWLTEGITKVILKGVAYPEMTAAVSAILDACPPPKAGDPPNK